MNSLIESKYVDSNEMNSLLETSKERAHPYYYSFSYTLGDGKYLATRIRKSDMGISVARRSFLSTDISGSKYLRRAVNRMSKLSSRLSGHA